MSSLPRILVVEDQRIVAADLEMTLRTLGYNVVGTAASADDALLRTEELAPELVLMDIRLEGGTDGIEAAAIIRERFGIPVIYLTAYADEETILRARVTSPFGYLVKPFNERELKGAIEIALYKHETDRQLRAREIEVAREEALRQAAEEAERRFRLLIDGIRGYAIFLIDPEGRVATWNRGAERIKGFGTEEILGTHFSVFYPPEDRARGKPEELVQRALAAGRAEDEGWRVRKDGSRFWANVVLTPIHDEEGRLFGFGKVTRDLTARRETEARLRESEARFRLLAENVREVFWIAEPDFSRFQYVSPACEAIWGRPADELEQEPEAFVRAIHPADRQRVLEANAKLGRGKEIGLEHRIIRPDGEVRWVRARGFPVRDPDGQVFRVVGVTEDFTEHRERDDNLRFLEEASRMLASSLEYEETLDRVAQLAVPKVADWCGVDIVENDEIHRLAVAHTDPAKAALAHDLAGTYPLYHSAALEVAQVLRTGEPELLPEIPQTQSHEAGNVEERLDDLRTVRVKSAMIVPMVARGRILGALTFVAAESGRRYDEDDLSFAIQLAGRAATSIDNARLYRRAVNANQAKSDFLAAMSHELRTPLNAVVGYTSLLEAEVPGPLSADQREQTGRIRASARHLLELIEEILTYSRLEAGREEVRIQRVEVAGLLRDVTAIILPLAERKGLRFVVHNAVPQAEIETDARRVRQILLNLLDNAIKFTPKGEIELSATREAIGAVLFSVRDTGVGIPPEDHEHLFAPFWQAGQGLTRPTSGAGLGLSVSLHLTRLLGGEIFLESTPGEGSTFTVRLPLEAPEPTPDGVPST